MRFLVPDIEIQGSISLMIPPRRDLITDNPHTMGVAANIESTTTKWRTTWPLLCRDSLVVEDDEVVKTTK